MPTLPLRGIPKIIVPLFQINYTMLIIKTLNLFMTNKQETKKNMKKSKIKSKSAAKGTKSTI